MSVHPDHLMVPSRDKVAAAKLLAGHSGSMDLAAVSPAPTFCTMVPGQGWSAAGAI